MAASRRRVVARRQPAAWLDPAGGRLGLPADFPIAPDGRVAARKYGVHAYDQWSADDLMRLGVRRADDGGRGANELAGRTLMGGGAWLI